MKNATKGEGGRIVGSCRFAYEAKVKQYSVADVLRFTQIADAKELRKATSRGYVFFFTERQFNKEEWSTHLMWPLRQVPRGEKTQTTHTH